MYVAHQRTLFVQVLTIDKRPETIRGQPSVLLRAATSHRQFRPSQSSSCRYALEEKVKRPLGNFVGRFRVPRPDIRRILKLVMFYVLHLFSVYQVNCS